MLRPALTAACLALGLCAAFAQADPIKERKDVMKGVGAATREGAAIAKGEAPFDAARTRAIFQAYADAAGKMPGLYPANSKTGDTSAAPKIWEDEAGFKAAFAKFGEEAKAAAAASTDLAAFRTAFGGITRNCAACHESYRVKR